MIRSFSSILILLLCTALITKAETFTVTSTGDSGPGTLREAILKSNANGTTEKDYIYFNLPHTTWAERTISVNSHLPEITGGNLVIDGSTQSGTKLGLSDARVILLRSNVVDPNDSRYFALRLRDVNDVEIYGMALTYKDDLNNNNGYGITMENARHIRIGAPGKGNMVRGFLRGIYREKGSLEDVIIQSNMVGVKEDGITGNAASIDLQNINGIILGGTGAGEGNHLGAGGVMFITTGGKMIITGNKMGINYTGDRAINGCHLWLAGPATEITFTDNHLGNGTVYLNTLKYPYTVKRNKMGTDATGTIRLQTDPKEVGIQSYNCPGGIISENIIAGYSFAGVSVNECYAATISNNEMFCNGRGINLNWYEGPAGRPKPFVDVNGCEAGGTRGIATPNSKIEIFEPDYCGHIDGGASCQGRKYIGTVTADANGKWFYPFTPAKGILVTATDAGGATSQYSIAELDYDEGYKVTQPTCGKSNGAIKMKVKRGVIIGWKDKDGNLISRDTSLKNLPPGDYTFYISSSGCDNETCLNGYWFRLEDHTPSIDARYVQISNTSCNQSNGYIYNLYLNGTGTNASPVYTWRNELGEIVGNGAELRSARPGKYTFTLGIKEDDCIATAGPFEIKNTSGPVIDISRAIITTATCGKPNGSITGVTISGTGIINYKWVNAANTVVGTSSNLLQVTPGKYVLKYSDASGCAEAETDTFTVADKGSITLSTANMIVTPAGCVTENGSITGIEITGATSFQWLNESGQLISATRDLQNVSPGKYRLLLENADGCNATTPLIEITRMQATGMRNMVMVTSPANCNENNGAIAELVITGGTPVTYRWMNENDQLVSTAEKPTGLAPGNYKLYATDAGGCEQFIVSAGIAKKDPPVIDSRSIKITPDECSRSTGAITGISVTGELPLSYAWYTGNTTKGQNPSLTGIPSGEYYLAATDKYGCKVQTLPYFVANTETTLPTPSAQSPAIIKGMPATITVAVPQQGTYYLHAQPGMQPLFSNNTGSFRLEGIVQNTPFYIRLQSGSCLSPFAEVMVKVVDEVKVVAPNAFSPNNDGVNDRFRIRAYGLSKLDYFTVFNRWGTPVFNTTNPEVWWDGQLNNALQPAGTYMWIVKGKDILGRDVQYSGHVLLIR
ncbi:T9SS type B sorting domain-containing protein [Chitinophaga sp. SYP-B3965]|uniref:gliding motility-associated C-terminal domain-containing protein n=1 Tax=Chitinophaga sp. SYP-B3965 TaxID=2663120 RepID=UPI001299AA4F|nr:gliding motility-associated C-terminal domain-containing protein [Chitinophaga sp. SYP-B3965]MRG45207.1 T9SS type B sorting domain-containing protein [Chitinophaga sp. SYP-B3965]